MDIFELELAGRVALAAVLGAVLGAEREIHMKTAGLRTHTMVSIGAALFTIAGAYAFDGPGVDRTRIAAQVVTGIGFIGAGGMLRTGFTVTGITTAATLWLAAALGLAAGFGLYVLAPLALLLALAVMVGFAPIRKYMRRSALLPLEIDYRAGHGTLTPLFESLNAVGARVESMSMTESDGLRKLVVEIAGAGPEDLAQVVDALRAREEVVRVVPPPGVG